MGIVEQAERDWKSHWKHQKENLVDPGGPAHRGMDKLRQLGTVDTVWEDLNPWEELEDPYWFDKWMVEGRDDHESEAQPLRVVFDHEVGGGHGPNLHVIGECPKCGKPTALDPPFENRIFLWHALRYGTPTRHICRDE